MRKNKHKRASFEVCGYGDDGGHGCSGGDDESIGGALASLG